MRAAKLETLAEMVKVPLNATAYNVTTKSRHSLRPYWRLNMNILSLFQYSGQKAQQSHSTCHQQLSPPVSTGRREALCEFAFDRLARKVAQYCEHFQENEMSWHI